MNTKVRGIYKLSKRDTLQTLGHGQTENEVMKKDIPYKRKSKESRSGNTHIKKKNRLYNKATTRDKEGH